MTLADEIRHHVQLRYVEEARRGGRESFSVVAGDVHRDMKLANRMPAVCGALRSKALQSECGITPIGWSGPNQSSTSVATFKFTDVAKHSVAEKDVVGPHGSTTLSTRVDSPTAAWQRFEDLARERMQVHFGQPLHEMELSSVPKRFDMVSIDGSIVGDAKYLSLVAGLRTPPAKFMEIAGHVWLLERISAARIFLVFGNQREVLVAWLKKYGRIAGRVEMYFLDDNGGLDRLH